MPFSRTLAVTAAVLLLAVSTGWSVPDRESVAAGSDVRAEVGIAAAQAGASPDTPPAFERVADQEPALAKPGVVRATTTDLSGEVYALGVRADATRRTVTFDQIDWFFGEAATAACRADKVEIPPAAWCNDFYYRNRDSAQRTAGFADSATITIADYFSEADTVPQKPATVKELDERIKESECILILTIRDGLVVDLREQFTP